jgi:FkbM family methyltransferase
VRLAIQRLPLRLTNRQRLYNFFALDASPKRPLPWSARTGAPRTVEVIFDPRDELSRQWYFWGYSGYEPATTKLLQTLLNTRSCVLDVGANIGYYALLAASMVEGRGQVHAFEPAPEVFRSLRQNVDLNHFRSLKINEMAVSDLDGELRLFVPLDLAARTNASLVEGFVENVRPVNVPSVRLDTYCEANQIERVDLLRVDVEGAEVAVLRGIGTLLQSCQPDIVCEVLPPYAQEMDQFFASTPYRKFLITEKGLVEMSTVRADALYRDYFFSCSPNDLLVVSAS